MKWTKIGHVFSIEPHDSWMRSHAQVPTVDMIGEDRVRVYFGTRDDLSRTRPTFIEVQATRPQNVLYVHDAPVMDLGNLGTFDDSGVMPSQIVNHQGKKYLFYVGWNLGKTVPFRNSIGVAVSFDGGITFTRVFDGPILDRTHMEPYFCATPYIDIEDNHWRMWYLSCLRWEIHEGNPEPIYHIKTAESDDGFEWRRDGRVCIELLPHEGGLARPIVRKDFGLYRMWYSRRGFRDYRTNKDHSYRIGYAESLDGIKWFRKDDQAGIDVSVDDWDSEMICYPAIYSHSGCLYMLYNGNGFGRSGFGGAVLENTPEIPT